MIFVDVGFRCWRIGKEYNSQTNEVSISLSKVKGTEVSYYEVVQIFFAREAPQSRDLAQAYYGICQHRFRANSLLEGVSRTRITPQRRCGTFIVWVT